MKKKILVISIVLMCVFMVALFIAARFMPALLLGFSQSNCSETYISSSTSPDGKYILEAYKTEPGATVDFSIKVYIVNESKKELIYNAYHEYDAEIIWINASTVSINGNMLDLSKKQTYDWHDAQ